MLLSIIIVTYESEDFISKCLHTIIPQIQDFKSEVFVVDNASADRTCEIVKKIQAKVPNLILIENDENVGFALANNIAIEKSKGDFLFFINPDIELLPEAIKKLICFFKSEENIGAAAPQLLNPDGTIQPSCRRFPNYWSIFCEFTGLSHLFPKTNTFNYWKMGDFDHKNQADVEQLMGAAIFTSRGVIEKVGKFHEHFKMFFNDVDWCKRVSDAGMRLVYFPEARAIHHLGASVKKKKSKMVLQSHIDFFHYFEKHFNKIWHQPMNLIVGFLLFVSALIRIIGLKIKGLIFKK
ncbi:MAG: glycosyltransferase family 2 protein [Candidatus Marinimicrobia bacterium]|nr:glycosyltransferase family 2 protein [Candidatus Neomarinimicrobiota bacterium]